jgi:non-specific serine/threonine protein kinase
MPARAVSGRLPAEPTSFVGREAELAQLADMLRRSRLVTVTGAGGVGKTRLALRAARLLADRYPDGACLVELSALRVPGLLPNTVAVELGLHGEAVRAPLAAIVSYLRDREMLLILDTCEHLARACGELVQAIVSRAPGVTVLATSRQPLDVRPERTFPLLPLPVPDETEPGDIPAYPVAPVPGDAVDLFAQRAASADPGFTLHDGNRDYVIALCRRLAGMPLALELAAVRLRAVTVRELAEGLGLDVATGTRRAGDKRNQNLRTSIGWSYELCTGAERTLWQRLSVFAGTFSLAALVAVCADRSLDARAISGAVDGLVHKSVLTAEGEDRYRLLDPLREFAAAELDAAGATAAARGRHISYYLGLARQFERKAVSSEQLTRYGALRRDHPNVQVAIEHGFTTPGNDRAAIDIATSLLLYWHMAGLAWEGEHWLNRSLERTRRPGPQRARILVVRAYLLCALGEVEAGRQDAVAAIKMAERFGDTATVARGYGCLHRALTWSDDLASVSAIEDATISLMEDEGDTFGLAHLAMHKCFAELQARDPVAAAETCLSGLRRLPEGELWATSYLLGQYGIARFLVGEQADGSAAVRRALTMKHELADAVGEAYGLGILGLMAADQRRYERAVRLFGAAETRWERAGRRYTGNVFLEAWHGKAVASARESLGDTSFERLWDRGTSASPKASVLFAVTDADGQAGQSS